MKHLSEKKIGVLFEDDYYIAFEKPAGLLVIPSNKKGEKTLLQIVNRQNWVKDNYHRLHPCHRLDRDTSGVILFAKGKKNQQLMMQEFKKRHVKKRYIALVNGKLRSKEGTMTSEITDLDERKYCRYPKAKLAVMHYKVIRFNKKFCVVEVYPITGRTNQIRVQFSQIGHPILGDRKYGIGKKFSVKFRRTALHASHLQWIHPVTKKEIRIESMLPLDMKNLCGGFF